MPAKPTSTLKDLVVHTDRGSWENSPPLALNTLEEVYVGILVFSSWFDFSYGAELRSHAGLIADRVSALLQFPLYVARLPFYRSE